MSGAPAGIARRRNASPVVAFAVAVVGIALFSMMDALMKQLVLALGAYTTLLWRNAVGTVFSGALYLARPRRPLTRAVWKIHALRAGVCTAMAVTFFWGLARIPMAQAIALTFVAPLLSLFLAAGLLGERIARSALVASSIALVGVAVILIGQWRSATGAAALPGAVAVLASACLYALNIVLMRRQALVAEPIEVAFSQSLIVTALLAVGSPFFADVPALRYAPQLVLAAALAVLSLLLLAWAYARSDASHLSTSEYTSFVWAALLGWLVFDERVTGATWVGAALIVTGCAVAARGRSGTTEVMRADGDSRLAATPPEAT